MKNLKTTLCSISAALAGANCAFATAPDPSTNPFQNISVANVFRLHAPVESKPIEKPRPPLPPMALTGILDGYSKLLALLEVSWPNQPKMWLKLSPGESEGGVEVLRVDIKEGTVDVKVSGTETNLVLNRIASQPPSPAKPAQPIASTSPVVPPPSQPQLSRDQNALIIEAERERLRQAGDPTANVMPITHLTPAGAPGTEGTDSQTGNANTVGALRKRTQQPR